MQQQQQPLDELSAAASAAEVPQLRAEVASLQAEVVYCRQRVRHVEENHVLEVQRMRSEVVYHKR